MSEREDLGGNKYGRLTALEIDWNKTKRRTYWICECECGNKKSVRSDCLKRGQVKSCGCLHKEQADINLNHGPTHGMTGTRLYEIWLGMKKRCYNSNSKRYNKYGGKGIEVCEEWRNDFENFYKWAMENGYKDNLTIDRIDNDGDYRPENCRWATMKQQCNNRSSCIKIEYKGKRYTIKEIAEKLNIPAKTLYARYKRGDRDKRLLRPLGKNRKTTKGQKNHNAKITKATAKEIKRMLNSNKTHKEIAREIGVSKYIVDDISSGQTWSWV